MGRKKIPASEKEAVLAALQRGEKYLEIANRYGVTKQRVQQIGAKHGLRRYREIPQEERDLWAVDYMDGMFSGEIAKKFNRYPVIVIEEMKARGIFRGRKFSEKRLRREYPQIVALLEQGIPQMEVARRLGYSQDALNHLANRLGFKPGRKGAVQALAVIRGLRLARERREQEAQG